ncbi:MAG: large-conductance mechanosensitive channel protein MscL [Alphaproteobacteria bacterium]|nr:large-conductance mechanosensitive channel protein MscL [Alphaproteobacteria bacterium]
MKEFFNEFKKFAMRGNVMDMAVGIIIGAAFGKIVSSLVEDVIMPPIGWVLGNVDFSDLKLIIVQKSADAEEVAIKYGAFFNTVISFIIVAFAVFILIKAINTLQAKMLKEEKEAEAAAAPTTKKCPYCCSEIALEATRCPHCTSELKK